MIMMITIKGLLTADKGNKYIKKKYTQSRASRLRKKKREEGDC